jgi:hypothetical protein
MPGVSNPGHTAEAPYEETSMPASLQLQTLKALAKAGLSGQYSGRRRDCASPTNDTLVRAERT